MATVAVCNSKNEQIGEIELNDEIFDVQVKSHLLHEVAVMQLAKRRSGSASTKGRSEVRGGGRKPWRQKGTGRARAGTRSSPIWRGGASPSVLSREIILPRSTKRSASRP